MTLKSGMKLVVDCEMYTAAGVSYTKGDILELIEPTGQNPFNAKMDEDHNWTVKCKHFSPPDNRAIWCNLRYAVDRGYILL
jgi:hypothetical protein